MNHHEKHQYHFEKYLRNEMPEAERLSFDEKLSEDASLRLAFEYYKLNREELLGKLIEDHRLLRRDNRFNKLIFLLISLTGIALTFNYFVYRTDTLQVSDTIKPKNIFIRYIPFLNWDKSEKKSEKAQRTASDTTQKIEQIPIDTPQITTIEPAIDGDERITSDQFWGDTFVTVYDKQFVNQLMANMLDSLNTDTLPMVQPTFVTKGKTQKLLVEYWQSPVKYCGYLFTQNKLVVYGLSFPSAVYIYKQNEKLFAVLPTGTFPLNEQSNFTPF